jgi:hypothetical protein
MARGATPGHDHSQAARRRCRHELEAPQRLASHVLERYGPRHAHARARRRIAPPSSPGGLGFAAWRLRPARLRPSSDRRDLRLGRLAGCVCEEHDQGDLDAYTQLLIIVKEQDGETRSDRENEHQDVRARACAGTQLRAGEAPKSFVFKGLQFRSRKPKCPASEFGNFLLVAP